MNMDAVNGRQKFPPIYEHPHWWAIQYGELEQFQAAYTLNCDCAAAINRTLAKHYDFDTGHPDLAPAVKEIVDKFGFDRTMYVLANAVWDYAWTGGISESNKQWALDIPSYDEPHTPRGYAVKGNPDVIDRLINQVRHDHSRVQQPQAHDHDHDEPVSPQEIASMDEEALHTVLLQKLGEEQSTFRSQLLSQTPEEILNKAAEYAAREDILSMMQWRTLDKPGYIALLTSPAALDALYAQYHDMDSEREDFLRECIDTKIQFMMEDQEELAQKQAEAKAEQPDQHRSSVLDRLAVPSVPGEKSTSKPKKEEVR